jgi:hypothetical protein
MVNKKILILSYIILALAVVYFIMPPERGIMVWASFIALAGFYYARWFKRAVFISSAIACYIVFSFAKEYPFSSFSACIIFLSLIPLPYYFHIKSRVSKKELSAKSRILKIKYRDILSKYKKSVDERQKYTNETDGIIQLYITAKKLSRTVSKEEYVEMILNTIDKNEIIGCSILENVKFEWKLLASSGILKNKDLIPYIHSLKFLGKDKNCDIIDHE